MDVNCLFAKDGRLYVTSDANWTVWDIKVNFNEIALIFSDEKTINR